MSNEKIFISVYERRAVCHDFKQHSRVPTILMYT